jgi:hypothetical protein
MTTIADTTDLAQRARDAYSTAQVQTRHQETRRLTDTVGEIRRALATLDIIPNPGEAFINTAGGQICVPLIAGGVRVETDEEGFEYLVQTHAVAAEWDADDRSVYLVADRDYDEPSLNDSGRSLYFAGYLHTLADLGRAIENGGRKPSTSVTVENQALQILHGLNGDFLDTHDTALLAAAEAVCTALADVADAIRAGHGL